MKRTTRNFDGRIVRFDPRDKKFPFRRPRAAAPAGVKHWRDDWYRGDQGDTPHCVGFAWLHWLANDPIRGQYLTPAGIYDFAQRLDDWKGEAYEGTSVRAGCKALRSLGYVERFEWCATVDQVAAAILTRGPVVFGSTWFEGMNDPDGAGYVDATGEQLGGHAYLLNGVDTHRRRFRLLNSWGPNWGDVGRAWLSFDDAAELLADDGEACSALERRPSPN